MKLTTKFLLCLCGMMLVVLGVSGWVRYQRELELFDADMQHDAEVLADSMGAAVARIWRTNGEAAAMQLIARANSRRSHMHLRWVWLDAPATDASRPAQAPARLDALAPGDVASVRDPRYGKDGALFTYARVDVPGGRPGAMEIRESLSAEKSYVRTTLRHTILTTLALFALSGALAAALGYWMVGRPVALLAGKARRVGGGDLTGPLIMKQHDELGELAAEMNRMCDQLAAEMAARQTTTEQLRHADRLMTVGKLASGIAHELGTPLNVVAGRAGLVADGEVEGAEARDSARIIAEQAQRMTRIIRQLLDFARPRPPHAADVELRHLAERRSRSCTR
jgi:signal transduction histidine kinase